MRENSMKGLFRALLEGRVGEIIRHENCYHKDLTTRVRYETFFVLLQTLTLLSTFAP